MEVKRIVRSAAIVALLASLATGCSGARSDFPGAQGQVNQAARALAESIRRGEVIDSEMPIAQAAATLGLGLYGEAASVGDSPVLVTVNSQTSIDVVFGETYRERLELWGEEARDYLFCVKLDYDASQPAVTIADARCPEDLTPGERVTIEQAGLNGGWSRREED